MDWDLARKEERATLRRIVALLLALADLAELACGRSRVVRGFVIWLLLPAEAAARNLIAGTPARVPFLQTGDSPADAMRLAGNLRDLARELDRRVTLAFAVHDGIGQNDALGAQRVLTGVRSLIDALVFLTPARTTLRPADLLDTS